MLKYASITKSGDKKHNEDYFKVSADDNKYCFVVCDGLGGYESGDVASKITANTFGDELYYCDDISNYLLNAFIKAQKQIESHQNETSPKKSMKTTAVCMATDGINAYVGHVGDSRFYGFKKNGTYIRTLDHSIAQLLVQSNTINESEIRNHPNRNMLLKAMGDKWDEPLCELSHTLLMHEFTAFLLCSDGFWELINEEDMISTLDTSQSPDEWLEKMIQEIENNGRNREMDNYTAIAIIV